MKQDVIDWLMQGDVSVQYQTARDLMGQDSALQSRIATEGWGAQFMLQRNPDGTWGRGFYQPKWTSSHYTLLDLKNLALPADQPEIRESVDHILATQIGLDGGINPSGTIKQSDVCINGMFLSYACYFGAGPDALESVVDFILSQQLDDGGFNCQRNRSGARHSSMHSTLSVLEGILEYARNGYIYRVDEMHQSAAESREFLLMHSLYRSDRTGEVIHREFLSFAFPQRWKYNVLRALNYFQDAEAAWDERMSAALDEVLARRQKDGRWLAVAGQPGQVHFTMEQPRQPGRWNTLSALRVLKRYASEAGILEEY